MSTMPTIKTLDHLKTNIDEELPYTVRVQHYHYRGQGIAEPQVRAKFLSFSDAMDYAEDLQQRSPNAAHIALIEVL
jgi:hypothetical protein